MSRIADRAAPVPCCCCCWRRLGGRAGAAAGAAAEGAGHRPDRQRSRPSSAAGWKPSSPPSSARRARQIAVLIVPTHSPKPSSSTRIRVAEAWKLGRKGVDDGVLLLVAKNDRKLRIEVGYGLEGALPDAVGQAHHRRDDQRRASSRAISTAASRPAWTR